MIGEAGDDRSGMMMISERWRGKGGSWKGTGLEMDRSIRVGD